MKHPYVMLTKRQEQLLRMMHDQDEEMVVDGEEVWVGDERTTRATLNRLLMFCLVTGDSRGSGFESGYYNINETGRRYLAGEVNIYALSDGRGDTKMSSTLQGESS